MRRSGTIQCIGGEDTPVPAATHRRHADAHNDGIAGRDGRDDRRQPIAGRDAGQHRLPSSINRTSSTLTGISLPATGAPTARGRAAAEVLVALAAATLVAGWLALRLGLGYRAAG